jgi:hypothetical protein
VVAIPFTAFSNSEIASCRCCPIEDTSNSLHQMGLRF